MGRDTWGNFPTRYGRRSESAALGARAGRNPGIAAHRAQRPFMCSRGGHTGGIAALGVIPFDGIGRRWRLAIGRVIPVRHRRLKPGKHYGAVVSLMRDMTHRAFDQLFHDTSPIEIPLSCNCSSRQFKSPASVMPANVSARPPWENCIALSHVAARERCAAWPASVKHT